MTSYLEAAIEAARAAGGFLRAHFGRPPVVDAREAHDIKLELDRRTQGLIEQHLLGLFPEHAVLGEEGVRGAQDAESEWIVDPIDGTVNFFYGLPHFCVSIALRQRGEVVAGVIYDPMRGELWSADLEGPACLNHQPISVSSRATLGEAVISVGVAKTLDSIEHGLPLFARFAREARKCRMMGSAALDCAYVACGRLDAYIEGQISIWDIAAGKLLIERAGGSVALTPHAGSHTKFSIVASSGRVPLGL
ncbi:MAG: inositol monophosphatase [Terrimicrobiaceae bacterium]|nr:inositol monophosphatase [Terrimicrobiaceae bacterium]